MGSYFGKYRGIVTGVDDTDGMFRIRARVPKLLGGYDTSWALPCMPFIGTTVKGRFPLAIGDMVWIEFEQGDIDKPVWTGAWYLQGKAPDFTGIQVYQTKIRFQDSGMVIDGPISINGSVGMTGNVNVSGTLSVTGSLYVNGRNIDWGN